ncbi:hypothetical protein, partial [Lentzea indica]|uniref:hypothetical protein n=1 Tax=Lentzea indica TaxID=2604800 RepID=UPI00143CBEB6
QLQTNYLDQSDTTAVTVTQKMPVGTSLAATDAAGDLPADHPAAPADDVASVGDLLPRDDAAGLVEPCPVGSHR